MTEGSYHLLIYISRHRSSDLYSVRTVKKCKMNNKELVGITVVSSVGIRSLVMCNASYFPKQNGGRGLKKG